MKKNHDTEITNLTQAINLLARRSNVAGAAQRLSWTPAALLPRLSKGAQATTAELARAESMEFQSMGGLYQ